MISPYADWLVDFERRMALHDEGVAALARNLARHTDWKVLAGAAGFDPPRPRAGRPPDVACEPGGEACPVVFEVELPETLVRRDTVARLCRLVDGALDTRVVMIAEEGLLDQAVAAADRLLRSAGLRIPVGAIAPRTDTLTGTASVM